MVASALASWSRRSSLDSFFTGAPAEAPTGTEKAVVWVACVAGSGSARKAAGSGWEMAVVSSRMVVSSGGDE